jgi:uncharacterized repeat protein (TIGR03809 family)
MTTSFDAERYQRTLERWRVLAERRLEHMTVLYESGRWRRYFSEEQFIGVIRETRTAVDAWRRIVPEHETVAQLFAMADERPVCVAEPRPAAFAIADERPPVVAEAQPPAFAIAEKLPLVVAEPRPAALAVADEWPRVVAEPRPVFAIAAERPPVVAEPRPPAFTIADERSAVVAESQSAPFATPLPELRFSLG